jgi:hypothetical protein
VTRLVELNLNPMLIIYTRPFYRTHGESLLKLAYHRGSVPLELDRIFSCASMCHKDSVDMPRMFSELALGVNVWFIGIS